MLQMLVTVRIQEYYQFLLILKNIITDYQIYINILEIGYFMIIDSIQIIIEWSTNAELELEIYRNFYKKYLFTLIY